MTFEEALKRAEEYLGAPAVNCEEKEKAYAFTADDGRTAALRKDTGEPISMRSYGRMRDPDFFVRHFERGAGGEWNEYIIMDDRDMHRPRLRLK